MTLLLLNTGAQIQETEHENILIIQIIQPEEIRDSVHCLLLLVGLRLKSDKIFSKIQ